MLKEKTLDEKIIFIDNLIASTFSKKMHLYYCDIIEEIERLNKQIEEYQKALDETTSEKIDLDNIIKKLEQENAVLKIQVVNKDKYSYGIRMGSDKE